MSRSNPQHQLASPYGTLPSVRAFAGFTRPTANFVRTPNQYLDLCLPHCSIHVARLVGFMIRETIGWTRKNGEPRRSKVSVTYSELVKHARISRAKLRGALDEAMDHHFIRCVKRPKQQVAGRRAETGVYELKWDERGTYEKSFEEFRGFKFGGDCRTPVPNQFFDEVLRGETHSVIRIVGAVMRHTVGFQNGITGERVEEAPLSYNRLLAFSPMHRETLSLALAQAERSGYIRVVKQGRFSSEKKRQVASVYAVQWAPDGTDHRHAPPPPPASGESERFTNPTRKPTEKKPGTVHESDQRNGSRIRPEERFTNPTSHGSRIRPEERFTNPTILNTDIKTQQQRPPAAAVFPGGEDEGEHLLRVAGFDAKAAGHLARLASVGEIRRQIEWLPRRKADRNPLGLLREAIEGNWAEPVRTSEPRGNQPSRVDVERQNEATRDRHEKECRPAYEAYLAQREAALKAEVPERYEAFERARQAARRELETSSFPPRLLRRMLDRHDMPRLRLSDLESHFPDKVLSFWDWDRAENANGLAV